MAISPDLRSYYGFFDALSHLERLVATRSTLIYSYSNIDGIGKAILQKIQELLSTQSLVSNYDCCTILDRLIEIRIQICKQSQELEDDIARKYHSVEAHLHWGGVLDQLMEIKLDNLVILASEEHKTSDEVSSVPSEPMMTPDESEDEPAINEDKRDDQLDSPKHDPGLVQDLPLNLHRAQTKLYILQKEYTKLAKELADSRQSCAVLVGQRDNFQKLLADLGSEKISLLKELALMKERYHSLESLYKKIGNSLNEMGHDERAKSHKATKLEERDAFREHRISSLNGSSDLYDSRSGEPDDTTSQLGPNHGGQWPIKGTQAPKTPLTFQDRQGETQPYPPKDDDWHPETESDGDCGCSTICECDRLRRSESDSGCSAVCHGHKSKTNENSRRKTRYCIPRGRKALHFRGANVIRRKDDEITAPPRSDLFPRPKPVDKDTHSNIDGGKEFHGPKNLEQYESHAADAFIKQNHPSGSKGLPKWTWSGDQNAGLSDVGQNDWSQREDWYFEG
ncbi:hypothetical protein P7C71_g2652, partial [Lecanoromycetidae sp. Uapishka_2]